MKKITILTAHKCMLLFLFFCAQVKVWAQDATTASTANKVDSFLSQPWVWVASGIVLLLIIVGLATGSSKKKTLVTKTTVIKEETLE